MPWSSDAAADVNKPPRRDAENRTRPQKSLKQQIRPPQTGALCHRGVTMIVIMLLGILAGVAGAGAADVDLYAVVKTEHFTQESSGIPTLAPADTYSFQSVVYFPSTNAVTNATVRTPNNLIRTLTPQEGLTLLWEERFNSSGSMDFLYPHVGFIKTYSMTMGTVNDGVQIQDISYTLGAGYPITPQVLNWQEGQAIDHTIDFNLQWNNLGGDPQNPVGFVIRGGNGEVVHAAPLPFATNALNGASNSVVIPAHTLAADTNYIAALSVAQVAGPPNTNYALGVTALAKETQFPLKTLPAPAPPLLNLVAKVDGGLEVVLTGESNRTYQILSTTNWGDWQPLLITNSVSGIIHFPDPQAPGLPRRFYRGKVGQ